MNLYYIGAIVNGTQRYYNFKTQLWGKRLVRACYTDNYNNALAVHSLAYMHAPTLYITARSSI